MNHLRFLFLFLIVNNCWFGYSQTLYQQLASNIDMVVAKDGSGNYTTVKAAINAASNGDVIFVRNGTYFEKVEIPSNKSAIWLIGENVDNTIIDYNDYSGSGKIYNGIISSAVGNAIGTSTSHTLFVGGNDFKMMNISIRNSAGEVGQAVAFNTTGDRQLLYHCKFLGNQDTYYTWTSGRVYNFDCFIEGTVDYIFGGGAILFEQCQINTIRTGGYITAAATGQNFKFGYVFNNCKLTAPSGVSGYYLGRPWKTYAQTVFINSEVPSSLNPLGWREWNSNEGTCYYAEYNNCGGGANTSNRVGWSNQLSTNQGATYTLANIFKKDVNPSNYSADWIPPTTTDPIYKIVNQYVSPFISEACFAPTIVRDCNGDIDGTASLDECGKCIGGNTGAVACSGAIQGEDFCDAVGILEASNTGYVGEGYINFDNMVGSSGTWYLNSETAGTKTIGVRYANGGIAARSMSVSVNGSIQTTFTGAQTGAWNTWLIENITLNLAQGVNQLVFTATSTDGGPNVDAIGFVSDGLVAGGCTADCYGTVGGAAYIDNCKACVGGNTGKIACTQDCTGEWGGTTLTDNCGVCLTDNSIQPCTGSMEAESICDVDGTIDNNNPGFTGDGFVNTTNAQGAFASWVLYSDADQTATISFRFANGGTTSRDGIMTINGINAGTISLPPTGAWTTWGVSSVNLNLTQGFNNMVLTAITSGGLANIDLLSFSAGVSNGNCLVTNLTSDMILKQSIYPNPTLSTLHWNKDQGWILLDIQGVELESGYGKMLNLKDYQAGLYFLKLGNSTQKIVKE